jgi:hypothetical protein
VSLRAWRASCRMGRSLTSVASIKRTCGAAAARPRAAASARPTFHRRGPGATPLRSGGGTRQCRQATHRRVIIMRSGGGSARGLSPSRRPTSRRGGCPTSSSWAERPREGRTTAATARGRRRRIQRILFTTALRRKVDDPSSCVRAKGCSLAGSVCVWRGDVCHRCGDMWGRFARSRGSRIIRFNDANYDGRHLIGGKVKYSTVLSTYGVV